MSTTISELEQAYPDLVAQIRVEATTAERNRVMRHIDYGKGSPNSGGLRRAFAAIQSGEQVTEYLQAEYLRFGERQRMSNLRQEDSDAAGEALGATPKRAPNGEQAALAHEIERQLQGAVV